MKILLVSPKGDGAWFVHLLTKEGNDVQWVCASEKDASTLAGIIPAPLSKVPHPGKYDLIVFDSSGLGDAADDARVHTPVIGGSKLADELEENRTFGIEFMESAGIKVPRWEQFSDKPSAIAFLNKEKLRTVLKPIGEDAPSDMTYVSKSPEDMIRFIETRLDAKVKAFVLQEFVEGVEVSTEAWWTGSEWVALNHTLEEKKFMSGNVGPNTGCAGNLVWMPLRSNPIFQQGLEKIASALKGLGYVGMVDLNTIVTEGDVWGLEWTPRFGYEGTCNLTRLLPIPFGEFMLKVATGQPIVLAQPRAKFAATIRLSVPPYPNAETSRKKVKVPVRGIDLDKLESFVLYDVEMDGVELVTGGTYNVIGTPIGRSETIEGAFDEVDIAIKRVSAPDLQYRNDVRQSVQKRYAQLERWGWLRPIG